MDVDNVLNVMSSYDFSTPLKTVISIEDDECEIIETANLNIDKLDTKNEASSEENAIHHNNIRSKKNINECSNETSNINNNKKIESEKSNLNSTTEPKNITELHSSNKCSHINESSLKNRKRCHKQKKNELSKKTRTRPLPEVDDNKQKNYSSNSDFFINSTLRTVSANLLHIINAKQQLMKNLNDINSKMYGQEDLINKNLLNIKYSYFKMNYTVTVSILLPLKNNEKFINSFLMNTMKHGYENGIYCLYEEVSNLYLDMIIWTKEYSLRYVPSFSVQREENKAYANSNTPSANPEVITHQKIDNRFQQQFQNYSKLETRLISVPNQVNRPPPPYHHNITNQQNCHVKTILNNIKNTLVTNNTNCSYNTDFYTKSPPASNIPHANKIQATEIVISSNRNDQPYIEIRNLPNVISSKTLPTDASSSTAAESRLMHTLAPTDSYKSNDMILNGMQEKNYTNVEPYKHDQVSQISNQCRQQNVTRSISRDSGFTSPSLYNKDLSIEIPPTPFITEVTSLNPNIKQLPFGCCVVCQKSTRKVCLGCYKCHFCSYECMLSHWPQHRQICTKSK